MSSPDSSPATTSITDELPDALEAASDRDRHINIAFEAYRPLRPLVGKIRSENLLLHSLLWADLLHGWDEALKAVQRQVGRDRSVWGLSFDLLDGARPSWELRLLNNDPRSPLGLLDSLRDTLAPWLELAPGLVEAPPYAILGLRFDATTLTNQRIDTVELHERIPGTRELDVWRTGPGVRERVSHDLITEPKRHIDEVLPAIKRSEFVDFTADKRLLGRVMIPELFACRRLHISKRPHADALCYSGVNIEQLMFAYKRFEFPAKLLEFLTTFAPRLEHLLFDVAVEYRADHQTDLGRIVYPRVGYYGSL